MQRHPGHVVQGGASSAKRGKRRADVCIVGPSTRFLSGLTYYTFSLCNSLSSVCSVSAILMRQLLPTRLYPGHRRVGASLSTLTMLPSIPHYDGVDWFWFPTLFRGLWFLARQRPRVLLLQWWTGTVLHTYLALAFAARLLGARVAVEFHETLDPGEDSMKWASRYVNALGPVLHRLACSYVVHSAYDRQLVIARYGLGTKPITVIPHATYDHYKQGGRWREAPEPCCNLLYFGLIRPYKGVEDLIRAFDAIPPHEIDRYWLTIVGETWEGCTGPAELIRESHYKDRITFVNRYVTDAEVDAIFGGADAMILPYRRSSQSGTLHIALNYGLPIVVTAVGGLVEAVEGYGGASLVQPGDLEGLTDAIRRVAARRGQRFDDPRSWQSTAGRYSSLLGIGPAPDVAAGGTSPRRPAPVPLGEAPYVLPEEMQT